MFGISFTEILVILVVAVVFVGPKDLPEVARFLAKLIIKMKRIFEETRNELKTVGKELGLDDIKNEVEMELMKEKIKMEKEVTMIVDIYGNEHQVYGIDEIRSDKSKEELDAEIAKHNEINLANVTPSRHPYKG